MAVPTDENGLTGRECPQPDCEGYFKVQFGTGLQGEGIPCHCPYCGHIAGHDHFWTKEQISYAQSVAMRKITDALHKDLKKLEFNHKPKGMFGIGISMKFKPGRPVPIRHYREKQLETEVTCTKCTLKYAVYGVFAFCPDCGQHNSLQILDKNLALAVKMLDMALSAEAGVAERLIDNALEDCVSAFDGFGRELCRLNAGRSADTGKAEKVSFQNLEGVRKNIVELFKFDLSAGLAKDEWESAVRSFQKRHLFAHRMGVVDEEYIKKTGDAQAVVGRKIALTGDEVRALTRMLSKLALHISKRLEALSEGKVQ